MPIISSHAVVETSKLAEDVVIGPFSYVGPDVRIASGTVVESNVIITGRTTIGEGNVISSGAIIGQADGGSSRGKVKIGQANSIREHVVILAGTRKATRIGNDCLIMIACHVGAGATIGSHVVLANRTRLNDGATLADYARSSAFALVEPTGTVSSYSFVNSYTRVEATSPPFAMLDGDPFRVRGINTTLLLRCGFGEDDIRALRQAYRDLYHSEQLDPDPAVLADLLTRSDLNPRVRQAVETLRQGGPRE